MSLNCFSITANKVGKGLPEKKNSIFTIRYRELSFKLSSRVNQNAGFASSVYSLVILDNLTIITDII